MLALSDIQPVHYLNQLQVAGLYKMLLSPTITSLVPLLISSVLTNTILTPGVVAKESKLRVLPLPTYSTTGQSILCLSSDFTISYDSTLEYHLPGDLQNAAKRTIQSIWDSKHQYLSPLRGQEYFSSNSNTSSGRDCDSYLDNLVLSVNTQNPIASIYDEAIRPVEDRLALEAYTLTVPLSGPAQLTSSSTLGLFRGLTTFQQLFYHLPKETSHSGSSTQLPLSQPNSLGQNQQLPLNPSREALEEVPPGQGSGVQEEGKQYAPFAPYEIDDKPAFGWRAVLLDTSRNYFGVPAILKMLDTMSLVKVS
jgi:hexosaminidase